MLDSQGRETAPCGKGTCDLSPLFYLTSGSFWSATPLAHSGSKPEETKSGFPSNHSHTEWGGDPRALCVRGP